MADLAPYVAAVQAAFPEAKVHGAVRDWGWMGGVGVMFPGETKRRHAVCIYGPGSRAPTFIDTGRMVRMFREWDAASLARTARPHEGAAAPPSAA